MELEIGTLLVRGVNLVLWIVVAARILVRNQSLSLLARRAVATVIVFGMSVLVLGATVPFGFPGHLATLIYTAFTAYAAILAVALLSTGEPNGRQAAAGDDDPRH